MAIYTNLYLLVFLPVVLIVYQLAPKKARWGVLLAASYALYISFSKYLVLLLMATSARRSSRRREYWLSEWESLFCWAFCSM